MSWQDLVLSCCSIIFTIALVPTVFGKNKPELSTSVLTSVVLGTVAFTYSTLSLWFSVFATSLSMTAWAILAAQKYNQQKKA